MRRSLASRDVGRCNLNGFVQPQRPAAHGGPLSPQKCMWRSHGKPGRIQVTAQVRDRSFDRYRFDGPSRIFVTGRGDTETCFLAERCDDRPKESRLGPDAIESRKA